MEEANRNKRFKKSLLMVMLGMILMLACGSTVFAKTTKPYCATKVTMRFLKSYNGSRIVNNQIYIGNLQSDAVISNLKCNNKRVKPSIGSKLILVNPAIETGGLDPRYVTLKVNEKAKITFTVKQGGKKYNLSCAVTLKKEVNPFTSISFNGKKFKAIEVDGDAQQINVYPFKSSKLKIKLNMRAGYKIIRLTAEYFSSQGQIYDKTFKNGDTIPYKKNGARLDMIYLCYYNTADLQNIASVSDLKQYAIPNSYRLIYG